MGIDKGKASWSWSMVSFLRRKLIFYSFQLTKTKILDLCWQDCDFEQNIISVNHALIYRKFTDEPCHYSVAVPMTLLYMFLQE